MVECALRFLQVVYGVERQLELGFWLCCPVRVADGLLSDVTDIIGRVGELFINQFSLTH